MKECRVTAHTDSNDHVIKQKGVYTHLTSPERIEIRLLRKFAKDRSKSEAILITQIYEEELAYARLSVAAPSGNATNKHFCWTAYPSLHDSSRIRSEPNLLTESSSSSSLH